MAIWPFNRRKKEETEPSVPAEVQEYYQTERRERMGVAWLIAFASLVVTVLVALGLFFGGRWVYRKVANNNKPSTTQTATTSKPKTQVPVQSTPKTSTPSSGTQPSQSTPSGQTAPSSGTPTPPASGTPRASTPSANSNLARTGPSTNLALMTFSLTTIFGYLVALRRFQSKES